MQVKSNKAIQNHTYLLQSENCSLLKYHHGIILQKNGKDTLAKNHKMHSFKVDTNWKRHAVKTDISGRAHKRYIAPLFVNFVHGVFVT